MTREEEIERHAAFVGLKVRDNAVLNGLDRLSAEIISVIAQTSAIDGAEWADSHPRKGLVDIEKVVNWLKEQKEMVGVSFQDDFYERLKKAMEKGGKDES